MNDEEKHIVFFFSNYIHALRNEVRQTERWLQQARSLSGENGAVIERYQDKIRRLQEQIQVADHDDPDFRAYRDKQLSLQEKNNASVSKRMETTLKEKERQKQQLDAYYQTQRDDRRKERQLQWQMKREYDRLCSIDATLPSYMRENLRDFPNNKGYIFKDVWYFGHRPVPRHEDPRLTVMFQKKFPGNTLLIHEIKTGEYYRIYEKKNKNTPKVLIQSQGAIAP